MRRALRAALVAASAILLAACASPRSSPSASGLAPSGVRVPDNGWSEEKKALHALDRLGYGPRPGETAGIARSGVGAWIGGQLHLSDLDDAVIDAKLRQLPTLSMTIPELLKGYRRPLDVAKANGIERDDPEAREKLRELLPPEKRPAVIERELAAAKLVRAAESRRQLQEVLVDFWFNHFNVFGDKGEDRWMVGAYEREAIRPHVFGRFRDLLGATAAHPAMLFYLDNWVSRWEGVRGNPVTGFPRQGINENYARELLELHTLGVGGGYTEQDVREVARCFTGWSIVPPRGVMEMKGTFIFRPRAHDRGEKHVLGTVIPAGGGREDGEAVLDLLAAHPSTARFLATKLCVKFVSDEPPPSLVARITAVFTATGGDLRAVYSAMISSPEFWADEAFGAKTKTPLELAASAVRALGGTIDATRAEPLAQYVARMGEPLYRCAPPTGYASTADAWLGAGMLVNRISFGTVLASGRIPGVAVPTPPLAPPDPVAATLALGAPGFQKR